MGQIPLVLGGQQPQNKGQKDAHRGGDPFLQPGQLQQIVGGSPFQGGNGIDPAVEHKGDLPQHQVPDQAAANGGDQPHREHQKPLLFVARVQGDPGAGHPKGTQAQGVKNVVDPLNGNFVGKIPVL